MFGDRTMDIKPFSFGLIVTIILKVLDGVIYFYQKKSLNLILSLFCFLLEFTLKFQIYFLKG
jgi:hypothetical protein